MKKIEILNKEWEIYCKAEFKEWKKTNPPSPFFLNNPHWMFEHEEERSKKWQSHITLLGNKWWADRGYRLIWPENPREPLTAKKIYKKRSVHVDL